MQLERVGRHAAWYRQHIRDSADEFGVAESVEATRQPLVDDVVGSEIGEGGGACGDGESIHALIVRLQVHLKSRAAHDILRA